MADSDRDSHPVFGQLEWQAEFSWWFTQYELPDGRAIDVTIDPGDGDRVHFLKRAADLFLWALANERRLLREAIGAYLLELFNESWRQADESPFDADGFEAELDWQALTISDSEVVPVEYGYDAGDWFGGHTVSVELDAALNFRGAHLQG